MSDSAPQLPTPQADHSEVTFPTTQSSANGSTVQNAKDSVVNNAYSAMDTVQNHPYTQSVRENLSNGPVAENVKDQSAKTSNEFRNLANARTRPDESAATGQPLTHYHSLFYELLSWENPRATAISFVASILFIFASRYLHITRYLFKFLYFVLGVTATAEIAGKLVFSQGLATSFRPKKYYTIPRESLERVLEDVQELINFFVIEFQRVLFAENLLHTITAFTACLISYWLIKFLPLWGLSLIGTSVMYLVPLVYVNNKEVIDNQLQKASEIANSQANQVKDLAGHHTARATETVKAYAGDYSAKAQNYMGSSRGRQVSPTFTSNQPTKSTPAKSEAESQSTQASYQSSDFPHAPKQEPTAGSTPISDQYRSSAFGGQAETGGPEAVSSN